MSNEEEFDLMEYLRTMPHEPYVEVRVSVTYPDGTVVEQVQIHSEALWKAYRPHFRGSLVRRAAEQVSEELDRRDR
jgi:hypothetical protein